MPRLIFIAVCGRLITLHTVVNARLLHRPTPPSLPVDGSVGPQLDEGEQPHFRRAPAATAKDVTR
jgi:hypothetical protein